MAAPLANLAAFPVDPNECAENEEQMRFENEEHQTNPLSLIAEKMISSPTPSISTMENNASPPFFPETTVNGLIDYFFEEPREDKENHNKMQSSHPFATNAARNKKQGVKRTNRPSKDLRKISSRNNVLATVQSTRTRGFRRVYKEKEMGSLLIKHTVRSHVLGQPELKNLIHDNDYNEHLIEHALTLLE